MSHSKDTNKIGIVVLIAISLCSETLNARGTIEKIGDVLRIAIPTAGFARAVVYEEGNEGRKQFYKAFATSQIVTEGLKLATHKERPNGACCSSFPSGHTSAAFMGASFIHKRYGWKYAIPGYLGASYVAYSRVHADKHFIEDVVAGAAIGILSSFYFTKEYKGFKLKPDVGVSHIGITLSKDW